MNKDFYPTPRSLVAKMIARIDFGNISAVLEPSAGKGDICDVLRDRRVEIDTIEIEKDLQATLKGKGYKVIYDDFLTFSTNKAYDLIIANFPFSEGDRHLQKALSLLEKNGGQLVCLVNAETLKKPFSNLRKIIVQRLEIHGAQIEYLDGEFSNAERKTYVEVALISATIEAEDRPAILLDSLKKEEEISIGDDMATQIVEKDFIKQLISRFNFECKLGISLINEYFKLKPHIAESLKQEEYRKDPIIELKIENAYNTKSSYINEYIKAVRYKFWELLLKNDSFREKYTTNLLKELSEKLNDLRDYDFDEYNIKNLSDELNSKIVSGIENTILKLFDDLSHTYHWHEETSKNIHYYNGWKTNKAYKVNKKVIIPVNGFSAYSYGKDKLEWNIHERMHDMVKVFNFLAHELPESLLLVKGSIETANNAENFRDLDFHYFKATFFKKGTCHITFLDDRLLAKFNIFGSQRKGWLPPSYGKRRYSDMNTEEKSVIDEFQGKEGYEDTMNDPEYYLVENNQLLLDSPL